MISSSERSNLGGWAGQARLLPLASAPVKELAQRARAQIHHGRGVWGQRALRASFALVLDGCLGLLLGSFGSLSSLGLLELLQLPNRNGFQSYAH